MKIPFVGESYAPYSLAAAAQESMNIYVEGIEDASERAKNVATLRGIPGIHLLANVPKLPMRGLWSGGGRLFAVAGDTLYEIASDGVILASTSGLANNGLPVQIFGNGQQLMIVSDGAVYIDNGSGPVRARFQISGTFTTVDGVNLVWNAAPDPETGHSDQFTAAMVGRTGTFNGSPIVVDTFTDATHITIHSSVGVQASPVNFNIDAGDFVTGVTGAYLDGCFIVQRPAGGSPDLGRQVNWSAVNDGTVWRGLDFKIKEGQPDYIQSIISNDEQLYVLGTESSEVWQFASDGSGLQRIPGMASRCGSVARYAPVSTNGAIFYMGGPPQGNPIAYKMAGGLSPVRISTNAVEKAWRTLGVIPAEATGFSYEEDGHFFWVINFRDGTQAWVFDDTTGLWHQRASWDGANFGNYTPWFHTYIQEWSSGGTSAAVNGAHIVANQSISASNIYIMSSDFCDDDGEDIKWRRAIPYRYNGGNRIYFGRMTLEMETGTVPSGPEPVITREYSDDRGETFVNPQTAGIGIHGDSSKRVVWHTGGSSRGRVWRFFGSGQYKVALIDLQCEEVNGIN